MSRIYLDHAATTPMVPEAVEAMTRELTRIGNASSLHASGRSARRVVEESREAIAARVGARPAELIFTSGGTESDNLAIKGAFWTSMQAGRRRLVTSRVEHHAVLDSVAWLGHSVLADVSYVPVDSSGRLDMSALTSSVDAQTGRPLSYCLSGETSQDSEIEHGHQQRDNDSNLFGRAAGHPSAAAHQTRHHSTERQDQRQQDIVD